MKKTLLLLICVGLIAILTQQNVKADTSNVTFDHNLDAQIDSPQSVVAGKQFTVNFLIINNGNYEIDNVTIAVSSESDIIPISEKEFSIVKIAGQGSFARTLNFQVLPNATIGTRYLNVNFTGHGDDSFYNTSLQIQITEKPRLEITIDAPSSIFTNAEFPFQATITGQGTGLHNATVKIISPPDLTFRGESQQTFSDVEQSIPITMTARLITNNTQVDIEHHIPFEVIVDYTDDSGEKKEQSATTSIILRPRSMFELGTEGGFWIGNTYFSPTVDIFGIVMAVGVPLGIYLYNKRKKKTSSVTKSI